MPPTNKSLLQLVEQSLEDWACDFETEEITVHDIDNGYEVTRTTASSHETVRVRWS